MSFKLMLESRLKLRFFFLWEGELNFFVFFFSCLLTQCCFNFYELRNLGMRMEKKTSEFTFFLNHECIYI